MYSFYSCMKVVPIPIELSFSLIRKVYKLLYLILLLFVNSNRKCIAWNDEQKNIEKTLFQFFFSSLKFWMREKNSLNRYKLKKETIFPTCKCSFSIQYDIKNEVHCIQTFVFFFLVNKKKRKFDKTFYILHLKLYIA